MLTGIIIYSHSLRRMDALPGEVTAILLTRFSIDGHRPVSR